MAHTQAICCHELLFASREPAHAGCVKATANPGPASDQLQRHPAQYELEQSESASAKATCHCNVCRSCPSQSAHDLMRAQGPSKGSSPTLSFTRPGCVHGAALSCACGTLGLGIAALLCKLLLRASATRRWYRAASLSANCYELHLRLCPNLGGSDKLQTDCQL